MNRLIIHESHDNDMHTIRARLFLFSPTHTHTAHTTSARLYGCFIHERMLATRAHVNTLHLNGIIRRLASHKQLRYSGFALLRDERTYKNGSRVGDGWIRTTKCMSCEGGRNINHILCHCNPSQFVRYTRIRYTGCVELSCLVCCRC